MGRDIICFLIYVAFAFIIQNQSRYALLLLRIVPYVLQGCHIGT
jgi:hypothetical protein